MVRRREFVPHSAPLETCESAAVLEEECLLAWVSVTSGERRVEEGHHAYSFGIQVRLAQQDVEKASAVVHV